VWLPCIWRSRMSLPFTTARTVDIRCRLAARSRLRSHLSRLACTLSAARCVVGASDTLLSTDARHRLLQRLRPRVRLIQRKMGKRGKNRLRALERMAAAAEKAMVKPLLPAWLIEIWREHVLASEDRGCQQRST